MWDISDVHSDIKEHIGVVGSSLSRRIRGRNSYKEYPGSVSERTSLLPENSGPSSPGSFDNAPAPSFSQYSQPNNLSETSEIDPHV